MSAITEEEKFTQRSPHEGVSSNYLFSKLVFSVFLLCLTNAQEQTMREPQGPFRPGQRRVNQILFQQKYIARRNSCN